MSDSKYDDPTPSKGALKAIAADLEARRAKGIADGLANDPMLTLKKIVSVAEETPDETIARLTRELDAAVADNAALVSVLKKQWLYALSPNNRAKTIAGCKFCYGRSDSDEHTRIVHKDDCILSKRHPGDELLKRLERAEAAKKALRSASLALANASDNVGVKYFDTDSTEPPVEAMQSATLKLREILKNTEWDEMMEAAERDPEAKG